MTEGGDEMPDEAVKESNESKSSTEFGGAPGLPAQFRSQETRDLVESAQGGDVESLNELDTTGVEPATGSHDGAPPLREDVRRTSLGSEEALSNAPDSGRGHFKVPRVLPG